MGETTAFVLSPNPLLVFPKNSSDTALHQTATKSNIEWKFCQFHLQIDTAIIFLGCCWMPLLYKDTQGHFIKVAITCLRVLVSVCACVWEYCLWVVFLRTKITLTGWQGLFCFIKAAIWHWQNYIPPCCYKKNNCTITTKAFTLSAVATPVYISKASILSEVLLYISMLGYISAISLSTPLISNTDLFQPPLNCHLLPFITVKYLHQCRWIIKHRPKNSTLCSKHANPASPLFSSFF